jgi:hypothetical protein
MRKKRVWIAAVSLITCTFVYSRCVVAEKGSIADCTNKVKDLHLYKERLSQEKNPQKLSALIAEMKRIRSEMPDSTVKKLPSVDQAEVQDIDEIIIRPKASLN